MLKKNISIVISFFIIISFCWNASAAGGTMPRISGSGPNASSNPNIQSKYIDQSGRDKIMDEYRKQLADRINGTRGIEVTDYDCDLIAMMALAGLMVADFIGISINQALGTAAYAVLTLGSANDIACWWSVVRNPVEVYPDIANPNSSQQQLVGKYKKIASTSPDGKTITYTSTDKYDEAVRTSISDYLTVCQRFPFPYNVTSPNTLTSEEEDLKPAVVKWLLERSGDLKCEKGKAGDDVTIYTTKFAIYQRANNICAKVVSALGVPFSWPQNVIGCHKTPVSGVAPMCANSIPITNSQGVIVSYNNNGCYSCYIAKACFDKSYQIAHSPLQMSSTLVQCFLETLSIIISGGPNSQTMMQCNADGILYNVQKKLYQALQALLALSITLYGIKIMLGNDAPKKQEVLTMLLKIVCVLYFCAPNGGGMKMYYSMLQDMTIGIADMLVASAGNQTICNYEPSSYLTSGQTPANIKSIPQLALWDRLDCRLLYYLGAPALQLDAATRTAIEQGKQTFNQSSAFMFAVIVMPALFTGQLLVLIAAIVIAVVVFAMIVWALQIYLLSALAMAIVVVVSPIFIPMIMFQYTKPFFDNWLKELIAYTLYPALLMGYLGFFFTVIDDIYFGDIQFEPLVSEQTSDGVTRKVIHFVLAANSNYDKYKNQDVSEDFDTTTPLIVGISELSISTTVIAAIIPVMTLATATVKILFPMLKMALALLMFMFFNKIIVTVVGELSGGSRSAIELGSSAQDPMKTIKQIADTAQKGGKMAKKGYDAAKSKLSKGGGGGGGGGGEGGGGGKGGGGAASQISKIKR